MNLKGSNQYDVLTSDFVNQYENRQLSERLQEKYKEKPLHIRLRGTKQAVLYYSYLANSVSFLTGFFLISYFLGRTLVPYTGVYVATLTASIIGLAAMGFIEYLKRSGNDSFYISWFRFDAFKILPFLAILATTTASVALSYYGGLEIPTATTTTPKLKEYTIVDISKVKAEENAIIDKIKAAQVAYFESNKKPKKGGGWRLSSKLMPTYNQFNDRIKKAEDNRAASIAICNDLNKERKNEAQAEYKKAALIHDESTTKQSNILGYLVLGFELTFLLSMWFLHWLDWKTYVLLLAIEGKEKQHHNDQRQHHQYDKNAVITDDSEQVEPQHQSDAYILIEGYKDKVFNRQRIRNFINSYQSKLKEWKAKKDRGQNVSEQSFNTIVTNLEKWGNYEKQLSSKVNQSQN